MKESPRRVLAAELSLVLGESQVVVATGARGLGQHATIDTAARDWAGWTVLKGAGNWRVGGYLGGFEELVRLALVDSERNDPARISRHEQSLKRLFPPYQSQHWLTPNDLTLTSSKEERTRFYHHEYQNKLLVGLSDFLVEYLAATGNRYVVVIDDAAQMSPTAAHLADILLRDHESSGRLRLILLDYEHQLFRPDTVHLDFPPYDYTTFSDLSESVRSLSERLRRDLYVAAEGNVIQAAAVLSCMQAGVNAVGYLDVSTMVDLYLSALPEPERQNLAIAYVRRDCPPGDQIATRNYETMDPAVTDEEHLARHEFWMGEYEAGRAPLKLLHALAVKDKSLRLAALIKPSEILKDIGLYDTWLVFFSSIFGDASLRYHGTGDDDSSAVFVNASFILYSLGCASCSIPYLEGFRRRFPESKFLPTVLYAQSMTYGRYQKPVDLPRAESYAILNLATIEEKYQQNDKYVYIKVFAENAYAYIKARQGKYTEALEMCSKGTDQMRETYGSDRFKLHQTILLYNTSQVYEITGHLSQAEAELRLAIAGDPYYGEYHNDLGNLLAKIGGRESEAMLAYGEAIRLCPPYPEAHLNRGMLRAAMGDSGGAMSDFLRALAIHPTLWIARLHLGNLYLARGEYEEAYRCYERGLAVEPGSPDMRANMGLAASGLGRSAESVAHCRAALDIDPRHSVAHNNLAIELFALGDLDKAIEHATLAVRIDHAPDFVANLQVLLDVQTGTRVVQST